MTGRRRLNPRNIGLTGEKGSKRIAGVLCVFVSSAVFMCVSIRFSAVEVKILNILLQFNSIEMTYNIQMSFFG